MSNVLILGEVTSLDTPPANHTNTGSKADGNLYHRQDDDTEYQLTGQEVSVTGARNNPEAAVANLLTVLAGLGFIVDNTTAS